MQFAVEIEDQGSWPPDFLEALVRNRPLILSYQRERSRIDKLCQGDVLVRCDPPKNRYRQKYDGLVERLETLLTPNRLVAYHCTRLTPEEINGIKEDGLRLLSPELVKRKFDECHAGGHISRNDYEYLKKSESVADNLNDVHANRTDMIWFCPNRSTLQGYSGVYRLFRSWGGEAVYCGHEKDDKIAHVLCRVGVPCIVKCAIPFERADQFYINFAERFISQFISDEVEYPEPPAGFDLRTKQDLVASDVLEIIEYPDPRFGALTGHASWPEHYRINGAA